MKWIYMTNKDDLPSNIKSEFVMLFPKNKQQKFNKELSQLYQDLTIIYAKNNQLNLAKTAIKKAIELNPNDENKEIEKLLIK